MYVQEAYTDPLKNAAVTSVSMLVGATAASLMSKDPLTAADAARNEALNNALSPKLKALAKAGPTCKAGTCADYVDALQTEKTSKQQEYDACMLASDCSLTRAAELSSELFRLKSVYEQTVRQGVSVGDLKWVTGENVVPTDYFDGLVGLGAVGAGTSVLLGGVRGARVEVGNTADATSGAIDAAQAWKGAGPIPGTIGVSPSSESIKALQNFAPNKGVEYVFDPVSSTFVVGNGSIKHAPLAASIGADNNQVVGGIFTRESNGSILTNEGSGHFWTNWTPEIRQQYVNFMRSKGVNVIHTEGK